MDTLGKVAGGDMRKAITTLQSAVRLRVSLRSPHSLGTLETACFWSFERLHDQRQ